MDEYEDEWALRQVAIAYHKSHEPSTSRQVAIKPRCNHDDTMFDRRQGSVVCLQCGYVLSDHIFTDMYNNLITNEERGRVSLYKRKHHFNERIAQWTVARERVPDSILKAVRARIQGPVTKTSIRTALRELRARRYIENWIEIYCKLTNTSYPAPDSYKVDVMKEHFCQYEVAFMKLKPDNRKAMINYNYVFVRLLQALNMPEQYRWFPPLKSRVKLRMIDSVFDQMCYYLNMKFVPMPPGRLLK